PVEPDDQGAGLVGLGPHVPALPGGAVVVPRDRHRPPDAVAQVTGLDAGQVFDQAEQIGAGRHDRAAGVVFADAVERAQHRVPGLLQVVAEVLVDHGADRSSGLRQFRTALDVTGATFRTTRVARSVLVRNLAWSAC